VHEAREQIDRRHVAAHGQVAQAAGIEEVAGKQAGLAGYRLLEHPRAAIVEQVALVDQLDRHRIRGVAAVVQLREQRPIEQIGLAVWSWLDDAQRPSRGHELLPHLGVVHLTRAPGRGRRRET
jgi:hypothetical protein